MVLPKFHTFVLLSPILTGINLWLLAKAFPLVQCPTKQDITKLLDWKIALTFVLRTARECRFVALSFPKYSSEAAAEKYATLQCNKKTQLQAKSEAQNLVDGSGWVSFAFRPAARWEPTFATFIFVIMTLEWAISAKRGTAAKYLERRRKCIEAKAKGWLRIRIRRRMSQLWQE